MRVEIEKYKEELEKYEAFYLSGNDDELTSIPEINKRLEEARVKMSEITQTLTLKEQTTILNNILNRAQEIAMKRISLLR